MITAQWDLVVGFLASLGGEGEGNGVAVGFSQDDFSLVNGVGSILEFGNIEAFLFLNVFADDLGEHNIFGDADLLGFGDRDIDGDGQRLGHQGDLVGLGLVFFVAVLVFASAVVIAITGRLAGGHLHGFGFGLISHLGDLGIEGVVLLDVGVGADLTRDGGVDGCADGSDLGVAVVVVNDVLDGQGHGGDLGGESGHADLSVDGGVGIPAVVLGTVSVTMRSGVIGESHQGQQSKDKSLHYDV